MPVNGSGTLPPRAPPTGISALIVGGGIAGLLAGLECWRNGHEVRILERGAERNVNGDALTIGTSAIRAVRKWPDMAVENDEISSEMWISWHKINGELISGPAPFRPSNPPRTNAKDTSHQHDEEIPKIYRHNRPAVHKMLADQVDRVGIKVEYGKNVLRYEEDEYKAYVVLSDGKKLEADLVIAADGVGSKSHSITLGHEVRARPTGHSMYRALLPIAQAQQDPIVDEKFPMVDGRECTTQLWMGEEVYALFGRTKNDIIWYLTYPNQGSSVESWSNKVEPEVVLQTLSTVTGWPEWANRLIKLTRKDQIHDFKLMWREPQPCWTSPFGRIVQIGDAAHTFLPSSGNGATQCMEDAVSLAVCLQIAGKDDIPWATRVHNKLRFERVSCLQLLGVLNHELRSSSANAKVKQSKPIGLLGSWIWKHDPEVYATQHYHKAKAHLQSGSEFKNTNIPSGYTYRPWTIDGVLEAKAKGEEVLLDGDWDS